MNSRWSSRRVVVTGGLGFIGSNLAIRLVELGAEVTIIDLPAPECAGDLSNVASILSAVRLLREDLANPGDWAACISDAHVVFHLAGQVSHSASMQRPVDDLRQNCGALLNVLEEARQSTPAPKIVFTSTRQVYGRAESLPIQETHPVRPPDINGIHKVAAEEYLRIYRQFHHVPSTTLQLTNTYGPRIDLRNPGRGVLNVFIARALRGESLEIFGDGQQRRDILYVDDVVEALLLAAELDDPGPFLLGEARPTSLREFLDVLAEILPIEVRYRPFPADLQSIDIGDSHCDSTRFASLTGWSPRVILWEGLASTLRWARPQISGERGKSAP